MRDVVTVLYNDFETLDVFGPIEVLGRVPEQFNPVFYSMSGGIITSSQKVPVMTRPLSELESGDYILFIPGGAGARERVSDAPFIAMLRSLAGSAGFIITVCTGSMILARTGILDGKRATSNKRVFAWTKTAPGVNWIKKSPVGQGWEHLYQLGGQRRDRYGSRICCRPAGATCSTTGERRDRIRMERRPGS